ncbi:MAG: hypothetical protein IMW89_15265 [Ktedonobacteraceae bacterium]|nr:hypothetical protein [Ktedonobacteraceae bacterium]
MLELLQMWVLVEVLGLICLPLTVTVFHNLPDRGWAFSKTLGLALLAFLVWLPLMTLRFLPFSRLFIAVIALALLLCCLFALLRTYRELIKFIRLNVAYIIAAEVVFLGMVLLLGWLRSFGPDIRSYEMFMDEGFIAAIMRSPHLPPNDMWFAGYSINYYYYAHYTIVVLAKLLDQSPSIAFNTGICIFFGLTASNLFGVTANVVAWARYLRSRTRLQSEDDDMRPERVYPSLLGAVPYGLLAILSGLVLGNLAATQQWWQNHGSDFHFDWFQPSRVIDRTINEFPAFSFLLSCFHAHVLTLAFTIMAIGLAFNLFLEAKGRGFFVFGRGWQIPLTLIMTALIIGGLFVMNGWDYPTYMGLALVCLGLQQWLAYHKRFGAVLLLDILLPAIFLVILSFLLYLPFYLNFISPSLGIGIVTSPADRSQLRDELLIYGLFAFVFVSLLFVSALISPLSERLGLVQASNERRPLISIAGIVVLLLADVLVLLLVPNSLVLVTFGSGAALGILLLFYHLDDRAHAFTLLLGALAFALVAGCEVLFLRDVFASQNFPRMNTVFKFYFQAWALLSIALGCGVFFILEGLHPGAGQLAPARWLRRTGLALWSIALLFLFAASVIYPLLAPFSRYAQLNPETQRYYLQRSNSLDGLTYLQSLRVPAMLPENAVPAGQDRLFTYDASGDYAAIRWLNANVQGDPGIIEAIGDDYSVFGRVSAFTGLPTPMGWIGHEYQWRVVWLNRDNNAIEFNRRESDVTAIYTSSDPNLVLTLMAHYHAQYLYVGPLEYARYRSADLHRFAAFMQIVYNAKGVTIYKIR